MLPVLAVGGIVYAADLFEGTTIRRWLDAWRRILSAAVADPERPVRELGILSPAERHQLAREWNDTLRRPAGPSVVERVLGHAERRPDAVAVVAGGEHLTYGQLVARADHLAAELVRLGVGPESVVAVYQRRSPAMVVSLLAVLRTGGAYLPLDPVHPPQRIAAILADARAAALVAETDLVAGLEGSPEWTWRPPVLEPADVLTAGSVLPLAKRPEEPEHLAYVFFTSGSTGRPKGVGISRSALSNLLAWLVEAYRMSAATRMSQVAGVAFDVSVWEIWSTLSAGGSLHLLPSAETLAPETLVPWLGREAVSHCFLPTAVAETLLDSPMAGEVRSLEWLFTGGDRLRRTPDRVLPYTLINLYGPTETCVVASTDRVAFDGGVNPSIGRPLGNVQLHVVDRDLDPVPVGVAGELLIGGAGVGRGYLGRPGLTADRFLPDTFAGGGGRVYRSGDLVRWLPDGRLDFLGRIDHQIQLRGLRIELGEIEAALGAQPEVREAVVLPDGPDGRVERLVAYVVPSGASVDPAVLAGSLRRRLPGYMVPGAWMVLEALPLTPSGKVDRRALPPPEAGTVAEERLPPRDRLEMELVQLWQEVLDLPTLGVRDDFFALGGHSLAAVRLAARIRGRFGVELPLATFFQSPTVESLAVRLRRAVADGPRPALVPIRLAEGEADLRPLFCVHPVGGEVLCYVDLARRLHPARSIYGLQTPADPEPTLEGMAERYLQEVRRVQEVGPYRLAGWSLGGVVAYEMARRLRAEGQQVELLALIDAPLPGRRKGDEVPEPDLGQLAALFVRDLRGTAGRDRDLDLEAVELPPEVDEEALAGLFDEARSAGLLPPDLDFADARRSFDHFVNNYRALHHYRPRSYDGSVLVLSAGEGPRGTEAAARGWDRLAADVEAHVLPADHYALLRPPVVESVARHLDHAADEAAPDSSSKSPSKTDGEPTDE